ncbi:unnamed protein product [Urochloa decumbens]|uniref:Glycosyltransferase n=1 Tax=Urochloa decumbens TaxID=240449 RepID=A0ABC9GZG3_9POAL
MESSGAAASPRPHVVLLTSPGVGHLLPLAELAWRLVARHGLAATLATFTAPGAALASLHAAGVATVSLEDLPADATMEPDFPDRVRRSIPRLRALLRSVSAAALVPDFFCDEALPLAVELGVPAYIFYPTNLAAHAIMRRLVALNDGAAGERRGLPDPLRLSAHVSLRRADIPAGFADSTKPQFARLLDMGRRYRAAAGFLVNSFYEMENAGEEEIKLSAEQDAYPPVYPVGPLVRSCSDEDHGASAACLDWLDRQPACSVVYVSFGSAGSLSVEQTAELAAGLESSGHRFLWVVRMPSQHNELESRDNGKDKEEPLAWLPEGFLERTSGRGLAVAAWAPQVRVLSHPATAAFVSHCGWNSALESVAAGVPMIAWPLYAEQRMNAAILSETVGVALRPREREDGFIPREEIAAAVTELMEEGEKGRAVRGRARDLKEAAARAWAPEGSSSRKMEEVAGEWKAAVLARQKQ